MTPRLDPRKKNRQHTRVGQRLADKRRLVCRNDRLAGWSVDSPVFAYGSIIPCAENVRIISCSTGCTHLRTRPR